MAIYNISDFAQNCNSLNIPYHKIKLWVKFINKIFGNGMIIIENKQYDIIHDTINKKIILCCNNLTIYQINKKTIPFVIFKAIVKSQEMQNVDITNDLIILSTIEELIKKNTEIDKILKTIVTALAYYENRNINCSQHFYDCNNEE